MKEKRKSGFTHLRNLVLVLIGISLFVFLVIATLSLLFGHSMWSWINVLRFIIGGAIVFIVCCYAFLVRLVFAKPKK
ncbi:hypothetical protein A4H97_03650 [Niastella yeongjuensis]|uniref:Uncharacterized protein n=1 Tax=Niastella yeongjuensis TaxID=354355 RepID=A0A1V9EXT6_9BACT|nr:hypothetical protein [Niastella yeongjuensis]OQP50930.1 hypothetical protein A4H97_03650 [Niastella yeongjuensis]SEN10921.1 hypothetical protein SAMN05660816_00209 [Niastella yeongjuensis]